MTEGFMVKKHTVPDEYEPFVLPDRECVRVTRQEMNACKLMTSLVSVVAYAKDDLRERLELVPDGQHRMETALTVIDNLLRDLCGTINIRQAKQLLNAAKELEVRLVPRMSPDHTTIQLNKDEYQELIDCAREKCKFCTLDGEECRKCRLYQMLLDKVPLDHYGDDITCPYAFTEWTS